MSFNSVGFIGGGRITRIMLNGFQNAGVKFDSIVVSDVNLENLQKLKFSFPEICISHNDNLRPAGQNLIFISLHPPAIGSLLKEIKKELKPESIVISLAPKITISKMSGELDGFSRIVRMIPNAPSIVNSGFNPVSFSESISENEKTGIIRLFASLGAAPIVPEEKLEAYAVLTAMGPTYFWFQFYELKNILGGFGLDEQELEQGIDKMVNGSLKTMFSGLSSAEVMDLIPVRPIGDEEGTIIEIYRNKLSQIHNKIKA